MNSAADLFRGTSAMATQMRETDWSSSPLGEPATWPASLRAATGLMLDSGFPMFIAWGPELTFLYNDAYAVILGAKHPGALARPFRAIWAEIWDDIAPLVDRALAGEVVRLEKLALRLNRHGYDEDTFFSFSYSPVRDDGGAIAGMFCACTETTGRVIAERALRELAESLEEKVAERSAAFRLYENIVQSDPAPICAFDSEFRLIAFNEAHSDEFYRIFAHRVQLGEVFHALFPPDQAAVIKGFMARALAGEKFSITEEFGDPDLAKPAWDVSYSPLYDEAGRIIGAFHHAKDISARLRAEAELSVAQDALRQAHKMEAVGQLTGGLAHDFNNLLTGIMGNLELLQIRVGRGQYDDAARFLTAAQGAGRRAASLTQRLLAFSRRQTLNPKPTDVNRLVFDMEDLIHRTIGPEIALEVVGAPDLWTALIDPGQLENALLNLCLNARDAMPDGGRLTIQTSNELVDEPPGRDDDLAPGAYLALRVSDTGTGMAPETMARAFDPFFTTKPLGEGTGLGLSMIYGFARQSGGQVRATSALGQGTSMAIYLPRHIGVADAVAAEDVGPQPAGVRRTTVMVVDDEPTVRMLVGEVLEEQGYTVLDAVDGPSGMKILELDVAIDLLVTDVGLPNGMNGRQVADAARGLRPGLPVLFITGYAENAAIGDGQLEPGMELLTKPFAMGDLTRRVRGMLEGVSEEAA